MTTNAFLSDSQASSLRAQCADLSSGEFDRYVEVINRRRLDPFARQIYYTKRGGKLQIESTIDGFRVIAQETGEYEGQEGPHWCGDDGVWVDVWLAKAPPKAARVGVFRRGFRQVLYAVANWEGYKAGGPMWEKMGPLMLAKCAEALALRKAFPQQLSGIYTSDEMDQALKQAPNVTVSEPIRTPSSLTYSPGPQDSAFEAITDDTKKDIQAGFRAIGLGGPENAEARSKVCHDAAGKGLPSKDCIWTESQGKLLVSHLTALMGGQ